LLTGRFAACPSSTLQSYNHPALLELKSTMDDLERRQRFFHPYSPYDIQLQFMQALYDCVETGKVGIFESPTGPYKLLS
jgi:hypothetical protein